MVFPILIVGAAIYLGVEKVRNHQKKKRGRKAQQVDSLQYGSFEPVSIIDNKEVRHSTDQPPPYQQETLPPYHQGHLQRTSGI